MRTIPDNSVDAIVTDPPYGLSFMGKKWDYDVPEQAVWEECLRVLKPGGHLLAFAGTRTQHRMAVRIEDAGFEIRDIIAWVYGSGFPKSLDVSKALDKAAGAERDVVGQYIHPATGKQHGDFRTDGDRAAYGSFSMCEDTRSVTAPATPEAQQWAGWGTALKPALEPITMARKPFSGTVAANVLAHGTGGINVDGCRVEGKPRTTHADGNYTGNSSASAIFPMANIKTTEPQGRWPANLIHDGSEEVVGLFPSPHGAGKARDASDGTHKGSHDGVTNFSGAPAMRFGDSGSAARFFYCAKASKADRDEGLDHMPEVARSSEFGQLHPVTSENGNTTGNYLPRRNHHPTVKPTALMRYLCRLVTPPGGTVLDPFMGSGSTGKAAKLEGFNFIGVEREAEYVTIAQARIDGAKMDVKPKAEPTLFD